MSRELSVSYHGESTICDSGVKIGSRSSSNFAGV